MNLALHLIVPFKFEMDMGFYFEQLLQVNGTGENLLESLKSTYLDDSLQDDLSTFFRLWLDS